METVRGGRAANRVIGEQLLARALDVIVRNPGIRPGALDRQLGVNSSFGVCNALLKEGRVRKERDGGLIRYYAVE